MQQSCLLSGRALVATISLAAAQEQLWKNSGLDLALLPNSSPQDDPEDSYQCVFSSASQYLDPPQPTGVLKTAFWDYGDEIIASCVDGGEKVQNCWPAKVQWCDFTTKASVTLTSALSAWGSSATSCWSEHNSAAVYVATECPQNWFDAIMDLAVNRQWADLTIAWSACDEEQQEAASSSTSEALGSTERNDRTAATDAPDGSVSSRVTCG
ncbi:hypothetical protein CC79DRAFT_1365804 [Sarocladium strictum]